MIVFTCGFRCALRCKVSGYCYVSVKLGTVVYGADLFVERIIIAMSLAQHQCADLRLEGLESQL